MISDSEARVASCHPALNLFNQFKSSMTLPPGLACGRLLNYNTMQRKSSAVFTPRLIFE